MSDEKKLEWANVKSLQSDNFIESKKEKIDLNNLHEEQRKRLQMLGLITTNEDGIQELTSDDKMNAILSKSIQNENPDTIADKYMMQHGLYDLLKSMTTKVVLNRPVDPIKFMIDDLEKQVKEKANAGTLN